METNIDCTQDEAERIILNLCSRHRISVLANVCINPEAIETMDTIVLCRYANYSNIHIRRDDYIFPWRMVGGSVERWVVKKRDSAENMR